MVSKIMIWPSRTISLPGYNSAKLSAGVEVEFDKPTPIDSQRVQVALDEAREFVKEEFKKQLEPYKKLLEERK